MIRNLILWVAALMVVNLTSCVHQVAVPIRTVAPRLVVEGSITTAPAPYTIKLSYSGPFTNTYQYSQDSNEYFITDAKVAIMDNIGDSTPCIWTGSGDYVSADSSFTGTVGRTYILKITLSDGKTYVSKPETIYPVAAIDSVTAIYDSTWIPDVRPNQYIVSVNSHDSASGHHYYRWTADGYIARKSWGGSCIQTPPDIYCYDAVGCYCWAYCEQYVEQDQVNVLDDQYVGGNEIVRPAYYIPVYWFGKDYVQVNQYSISEDVYKFWEEYADQIDRTGSILDPLPSPVIGNIYNARDSTDIALGIFAASAVTSQRLVIVTFNLQQYWLEDIAGEFIEKGDCELVYPGALPDFTDPPDWGNAPVLNVHLPN